MDVRSPGESAFHVYQVDDVSTGPTCAPHSLHEYLVWALSLSATQGSVLLLKIPTLWIGSEHFVIAYCMHAPHHKQTHCIPKVTLLLAGHTPSRTLFTPPVLLTSLCTGFTAGRSVEFSVSAHSKEMSAHTSPQGPVQGR